MLGLVILGLIKFGSENLKSNFLFILFFTLLEEIVILILC